MLHLVIKWVRIEYFYWVTIFIGQQCRKLQLIDFQTTNEQSITVIITDAFTLLLIQNIKQSEAWATLKSPHRAASAFKSRVSRPLKTGDNERRGYMSVLRGKENKTTEDSA